MYFTLLYFVKFTSGIFNSVNWTNRIKNTHIYVRTSTNVTCKRFILTHIMEWNSYYYLISTIEWPFPKRRFDLWFWPPMNWNWIWMCPQYKILFFILVSWLKKKTNKNMCVIELLQCKYCVTNYPTITKMFGRHETTVNDRHETYENKDGRMNCKSKKKNEKKLLSLQWLVVTHTHTQSLKKELEQKRTEQNRMKRKRNWKKNTHTHIHTLDTFL